MALQDIRPAVLGAGAATQHLGHRRADSRDRRHGADRLRWRADRGAVVHPRRYPRIARSGQPAALCVANDDADAAGHRLLDRFYLRLCRACRQEPARRDGADPAARYPAIGADPRLSDLHRRLLHEPVSRQRARRRACLRVRDLHQPGLEHDVQHVPVAAQRSRRIWKKRRKAFISAAGSASGGSMCRSRCRA